MLQKVIVVACEQSANKNYFSAAAAATMKKKNNEIYNSNESAQTFSIAISIRQSVVYCLAMCSLQTFMIQYSRRKNTPRKLVEKWLYSEWVNESVLLKKKLEHTHTIEKKKCAH